MATNGDVRLVIWDLDNTFWKGTLSEGDIEYVPEHHHIVERLVFRGIMSSICSKNDVEAIKPILVQKGAWDLFVFPSIDWTPKASRIADLIDNVQLRPQNVLYIDDCPRNRAEVQAAVPQLRVCSEAVIPFLLDDPLCAGKLDPELSRLRQYKLLERRAAEAAVFDRGNAAFLRQSGVRVEIDFDVLANLDRAVELISRTNQLNFTKKRLPADQATALLKAEISKFHNQAALIKVSDRYGDYGYCGFYLTSAIHQHRNLEHFCFSCRILGMGVERWLFQKLGRPGLKVVQPVVSDLSDPEVVDWINVSGARRDSASAETASFSEIRLWGGCELDALEHYLKPKASSLITETNYWTLDALLVRRDTTVNSLFLLDGPSDAARASLQALGLQAADLTCSLLKPASDGTLLVMSCWGDLQVPIYRHKELGFEYSFSSSYGIERWGDMTSLTDDKVEAAVAQWGGSDKDLFRANIRTFLAVLRDGFEYVGPMTIGRAASNWKAIAARVAQQAKLVVVLPPRFGFRSEDHTIGQLHNQAIKTALADVDNVLVLDATDHQSSSDHTQDTWQHLDRMVYFRLYRDMMDRLEPANEAKAAPLRAAG